MELTEAVPQTVSIPQEVRRNTLILAIVQGIGWVGIQMIATIGTLIAYRLTGDVRWAGIPITLFSMSAALCAPYSGKLMDVAGRKPIIILGQAALLLGSALAGMFVLLGEFVPFLLSTIVMGIGSGTTALSRSAAADMYPATYRARGLSLVIVGGAVGAVAGPSLLGLVSGWARNTGSDPLAVPLLAMALLTIVGITSLLMMRVDPSRIAVRLSSYYPREMVDLDAIEDEEQTENTRAARPFIVLLRHYPVVVAVVSTALVQAGMVLLMVTTSLTMSMGGHGDDVYGVMTGHLFGMLGLSFFIGRLADRLGRKFILIAGSLLFIAGAITAPLFENPLYNGASLFLVGLGWSLCYIVGTTIITDVARTNERSRSVGTNDMLVGLTGSAASLAGGLLLSGAGFLVVGGAGLVLGTVPLLLALRLRETTPGHFEN